MGDGAIATAAAILLIHVTASLCTTHGEKRRLFFGRKNQGSPCSGKENMKSGEGAGLSVKTSLSEGFFWGGILPVGYGLARGLGKKNLSFWKGGGRDAPPPLGKKRENLCTQKEGGLSR